MNVDRKTEVDLTLEELVVVANGSVVRLDRTIRTEGSEIRYPPDDRQPWRTQNNERRLSTS